MIRPILAAVLLLGGSLATSFAGPASNAVASAASPMTRASTPFGFDQTWWTAFGVIAALGIAVTPPLIRRFIRWRRRPRFSFDVVQVKDYSSCVDGSRIWVRVPIRNAAGCDVATNVEVFLERMEVVSAGAEEAKCCVPMRIRWCHTAKPFCDRIPGDSFRLLDLVSYQTVHDAATSIQLDLGGEVHGSLPSITSVLIPGGARLKLTLSVSADGISAKTHSLIVNPTPWLDIETPRIERA